MNTDEKSTLGSLQCWPLIGCQPHASWPEFGAEDVGLGRVGQRQTVVEVQLTIPNIPRPRPR